MRTGVVGVIALGMLTAACCNTETQRSATGALTGIGVGAVVGGAVMPEGADTIATNAVRQEKTAGQSDNATNH